MPDPVVVSLSPSLPLSTAWLAPATADVLAPLAIHHLRLAQVLRLQRRGELERLEILLVNLVDQVGLVVDHLETGVGLGGRLDEVLAEVGRRTARRGVANRQRGGGNSPSTRLVGNSHLLHRPLALLRRRRLVGLGPG